MSIQLVRGLLHPKRIKILETLAGGPASPRQLAAALDEDVRVVAYHVSILRVIGCVEPEGEATDETREGFYELTPRATPTRQIAPPSASSPPGHPPAALLRRVVGRGIASLDDHLDSRHGDHLSCTSIVLDQQGAREVSAAIDDALDRVSVAYEKSAARLADIGGKGTPATIAMASFGLPGAAEEAS